MRRAVLLSNLSVRLMPITSCVSLIIDITPSADIIARCLAGKDFLKNMVPEVGLEPTWALSPPDFESGAYTNFATPACANLR